MDLLPVAYSCLTPLLVIILFLPVKAHYKKYCINLLAAVNVVMVFYAVFLVRQLLGLLQMIRQFSGSMQFRTREIPVQFYGFFIREILIIFLCVMVLFKRLRINLVLIICLMILICWNHPFTFWNTYHLLFKIPAYGSLLCAAYALLWLTNQLPFQSRTR